MLELANVDKQIKSYRYPNKYGREENRDQGVRKED
jgi:hypothetical protein